MADKLTPLLTAALARAATAPAGTPLVAGKADPGLFPNTAAGKSAAGKAVADGLLTVVTTVQTGKQARELFAATEAGLTFLLDQASPKQVLEDFVRVLEEQDGQVAGLAAAAARMADSLAGLKEAVARVLPQVVAGRVPTEPAARPAGLNPAARPEPTHALNGTATMTATAVAPAPVAVADPADDLAGAVLTRLADWAAGAAAGQDCPLPDLYRSLSVREHPPTLGAFHDCLRALHADRRIYLHPWTGPLYALPEPAYALLAGHNVAYYASSRNDGR